MKLRTKLNKRTKERRRSRVNSSLIYACRRRWCPCHPLSLQRGTCCTECAHQRIVDFADADVQVTVGTLKEKLQNVHVVLSDGVTRQTPAAWALPTQVEVSELAILIDIDNSANDQRYVCLSSPTFHLCGNQIHPLIGLRLEMIAF